MSWLSITIQTDCQHAESLADALLDAGALSASIEDADAGTPEETPQFGEPGSVTTPGWERSRVVALLPAVKLWSFQVKWVTVSVSPSGSRSLASRLPLPEGMSPTGTGFPAVQRLHQMGLIGGHIRLPLTPLSESCQPRVLEALRQAGIEV